MKYTMHCALLNFFFLGSLFSQQVEEGKFPLKKCIIFKCNGGHAHDSAAKALETNLKDEYNISVVNIFDEIIKSIDPIRIFTFQKYSGEDFFNFCIQNELSWITNYMWDVGAWGVRKRQRRIKELFYNFIKKEKPDCLVSVIPIFNGAILSAAESLDIPFILITLDLDPTYFFNGICKPSHSKFFATFIFSDAHLQEKIEKVQLLTCQKTVMGLPLQQQFFEKKDISFLKNDFKIPLDKPVVLIMMGGVGSCASYYYLKELSRITIPLHIILCLGKNEKLRARIEKVPLAPHVTLTILSFTQRISDLMAISDLLITKPGPTTLCEALQMNLPLLLHKTSQCAIWEYETYAFIERNNLGKCITTMKDVNQIVINYLLNPTQLQTTRTIMESFPKQDFFELLKPLLREMTYSVIS